MIQMQRIIFMILPRCAVFSLSLSLPPSSDSACMNIIFINGKQDVLKQPKANTDLLYFSGLSFRDKNRVLVLRVWVYSPAIWC